MTVSKVMDFKWKRDHRVNFKIISFLFSNVLLVNKDTVVIFKFLVELVTVSQSPPNAFLCLP